MEPTSGDSGRKKSTEDFIFGKAIGEGSFSTVYLAKDIHTNKEYAIKVLEKRHIIREKKMEYVMREKNALQIISGKSPFFVSLYCTFQDTNRLYFVLTYAKNGELLTKINQLKKFDVTTATYYTAEIVLALETLHSKGVIHRDLKPENILFDENWNILITDFGSAKILKENDKNEDENQVRKRKNSFVGTAQYVSPELLSDTEVCFASDLWAMACILFQMLSGEAPFRAGSEYLIFQKIIKLEYEFPEGFDKISKDFIEKILILQPSKRLGANDSIPYTSIRNHELFKELNFDQLGPPPKMVKDDLHPTATETSSIPENMEPGFNEMKATRLQFEMACPIKPSLRKKSEANKNIANLMPEEIERRLEIQRKDKWHQFVEGNLIIKQGLLDKRKGLFPRRRMFLLTLGPHLYYVDPSAMVLKGEIPWSETIWTEVKNFKIFLIHTPNRTYYLEDPEGYALEWCKVIEEVKTHYYPK
ncbi:3-phosphoinositide-dependent protein kinase 1 [Onthophagus taurus]|uniref:3-phosphoinositide-dependent protein kinase 1 n=1 Tax=Onthophagus taurus TaxID=166361 RepID=UPI000C206088|nr:3-phosphoinositide-dependent protein kinase 1 [Onthophagus taurus]